MSKRLAIVGGGPGGLATARVFLANFPDIEVDLYEIDYSVGGIWHYPDGDQKDRVMYDHLETNITKYLMSFSGFPFPESTPLYPWRKDVYEYLVSYYNKFLKPNEHFNTHLKRKVTNLTKNDDKWVLISENTEDGKQFTDKFDFVILANGHYSVPNIPVDNVPGLKEWVDHNQAVHSKIFKNCEFVRDKTIVVIGNGSSGQDIVNQSASVAKKVYRSVTDVESDQIPDDYPVPGVVENVPRIKSTDYASKTVELTDGRTLKDVDLLIYATGFFYSIPFLDDSIKSHLSGPPHKDASSRLNNLWKQIIYVKDPTLGLSLLPQQIIPFPLAELQAAVMVKVFSGQLRAPEKSDDELEPEAIAERSNYHSLSNMRDLDHYDELQAILDQSGGEKDPLKPVLWDEEYKNRRRQCVEDKKKRNIFLSKLSSESRAENKPYVLKKFFL